MTQAFQRFCSILLVLCGLAAHGAAHAAAPYFITITGTPSSMNCQPTKATFTGTTLVYQLKSTTSAATGSMYINGVLDNSSSIAPGSFTGTTSGSLALTGDNLTYAATPFPYTLRFDIVPQDTNTDGVRVSFTCNGAGNNLSNYVVTTLPGIAPAFTANPSPVVFPATAIGATSAVQNVTLTNSGNAPATTLAIASGSSEFAIVGNDCPANLAVGAFCTLGVTFHPTTGGTRQSALNVTTADGVSAAIVVRGVATGGAAILSIPGTITFGTQNVGTTSAPSGVTVTNTGSSIATFTSIVSSNAAEFPITTNCTGLVQAESCTITATFRPSAAGARSSTITVTSNATGSPQTIAVTGTGAGVAAPGVLTVPATVAMGTQLVGSAGAPVAVVLTNTGGAPVTVSGVANTNAAEFAVASACTTVAPGATCTLTLAFTPAAVGARTATLTVTSNGTGSPQAIAVSGTGSATPSPGQLALSGGLNFGAVQVGTGSSPIAITATNVGGSAVAVSSVASGNPGEFAVAASSCGNVAAGASCEFSVIFTPAAIGERGATITITSSGAGSPQTVAATGTGVATPPPPPATADLIEYHHAEWDHYFVTSIADEIAKLDSGVFAGWARTGYKFKSYALGTAGSATVCRFFSTSFAPRSSHFYTPFAGECAAVKANPDWSFEGDVFGIPVPDLAGVCPAATVPVYRLYNNGQGAAPNHRYTTDLAVRQQMILKGWVPEGYGDVGVIMCAPV